jgi:hypothetical protein
MGFQLRVGVGEMQERHALAALIVSEGLALGLTGDHGSEADYSGTPR